MPTTGQSNHLDRDECLAQFELMLRIRWFERTLDELFAKGQVRGTAHLCIGQEAVPVGVCSALEPDDWVSATHRGHGAALAKGLDPYRMFAEILGRRDGYCAGRGGSQHIACFARSFLGTNGITGGGLPVATGAALAMKHRSERRVVVAFFGDGAVNQGAFHESLNMASMWQLPIVYVCENNQYAMSAPAKVFVAGGCIAKRAEAYGLPGVSIDGNDVEQVTLTARRFVEAARQGSGPVLVECQTYRVMGHSKSDQCAYRTAAEEQAWQTRDPISRVEQRLSEQFRMDPSTITARNDRARDEIAEAAARALDCPCVGEDTLEDHLYPTEAA